MMTNKRQIGIWVLGGIVVVLIVWALMPRPVAVDARPVRHDALEVTVLEEGKTRVIDRYVVSAPVAGYARRVELEVGDSVEAGQELLHLDPARSPTLDPRAQAQARAAVSAAQAALSGARESAEAARAEADLAEREYARVRKVAEQGLLSQGALDAAHAAHRTAQARLRSAEFAVQVAEGELNSAQARLDYEAAGPERSQNHVSVGIASPVSGRVLKVIHESEGAVAEGQALLEVGDPSALEVEVEVLSMHAVQLHPGMSVRFLRWGGERPLVGVVKVVEPTGFTKVSSLGVEEQRVRVICDITSPYERWKSLGDGYRVEAEFILWEGENVLQVPTSALFRSGEDWSVFRIEDGRAHIREVEIGARSGLAAEVLAGLEEGDRVIVYPGDNVSDGKRVEVR